MPAMEDINQDAQPLSRRNMLACLQQDDDRFFFTQYGPDLQVAARPSENHSRSGGRHPGCVAPQRLQAKDEGTEAPEDFAEAEAAEE